MLRPVDGAPPADRLGFALFFCLTFALGALWAIATPVMGVPDEPAHVIRAASVVRGQLVGTSTVEQAGKRVDRARIPETLAWPEVPCFAHNGGTPACDVAPQGRGDVLVEVESRFARYDPVYYAIVGLPTLVAPGRSTIYLMRLVTALLVAGLLGLAAIALLEAATPRWALVGLAAAVTPMELFLAGSVNPSALEIAAGLALWATLLSWFSCPDPQRDRSRAIRAAVAATALVLSRALAPLFLALIVGGAMLLLPRGALRQVARRERIVALTVGGVALAAVAWTLVVGTLDESGVEHPEFQNVRRYLYSVILSLDDFERQMIGNFGWLDTPAQSHVYSIWFMILGFLVVAALAVGGTRERFLLLGLLALSAVVPIVVQWPVAPELGLIWQGRYLLPLMVGLPVAAGWVLSASERWNTLMDGAWPFWIPVGTLAVLQVAAYWWALHRNVIGLSEDWIGFDPLWQPPLGWIPLTLAYAVAVAAWTAILARLARPAISSDAGTQG